MNKPEARWKDYTSYAPGEKERGQTEPIALALQVGKHTVATLINGDNGWYVGFGENTKDLSARTVEYAKVQALEVVREYFRNVSDAIEELSNE